jgi:hypothetical protein
VPPPAVDRATLAKYDVPLTTARKAYVVVQFALLVVGTVAFLYASPRLDAASRAALGAAAVVGLVSLGGLLDRRPWAVPLEAARLVASLTLFALPLSGALR